MSLITGHRSWLVLWEQKAVAREGLKPREASLSLANRHQSSCQTPRPGEETP